MALVATAFRWPRIPAFLPVFVIVAGAVGLSACQSNANRSSAQTAVAPPPAATGAPVALTGATYTEAAIAANPKPVGPSEADIVKPSGPSNQAVVASTPLPGSTTLAMPPPAAAPPPPAVASAPATEPLPGLTFSTPPMEPLPGLAPAPEPAPSVKAAPTQVISAPSPVGVTPTMPTVGATGSAVDEKGFPNINVQPVQPTAQLLSPEERAKLIAELNALAGRPAQ
jgi:hypothetical protein